MSPEPVVSTAGVPPVDDPIDNLPTNPTEPLSDDEENDELDPSDADPLG
jgi:hypothetical protein